MGAHDHLTPAKSAFNAPRFPASQHLTHHCSQQVSILTDHTPRLHSPLSTCALCAKTKSTAGAWQQVTSPFLPPPIWLHKRKVAQGLVVRSLCEKTVSKATSWAGSWPGVGR